MIILSFLETGVLHLWAELSVLCAVNLMVDGGCPGSNNNDRATNGTLIMPPKCRYQRQLNSNFDWLPLWVRSLVLDWLHQSLGECLVLSRLLAKRLCHYEGHWTWYKVWSERACLSFRCPRVMSTHTHRFSDALLEIPTGQLQQLLMELCGYGLVIVD